MARCHSSREREWRHDETARHRHRRHRHQGSARSTPTPASWLPIGIGSLTPHPATPEAVAKVVGEVAAFFNWKRPAGATFPAVIKNGVALHGRERRPVVDRHRRRQAVQRRDRRRRSPCSTTPTPPGSPRWSSAREGRRRRRDHGDPRHRDRQRGVPRRQARAQHRARSPEDGQAGRRAHRRRERARNESNCRGSSGRSASTPTSRYLEALFSPDLIIVGGGVSKKSEKFLPLISTRRRHRARAAPQRGRHRGCRGRAPARVLLRRLAERRSAGESGVGPVPPFDGVLAVEPTQEVVRDPTGTARESRSAHARDRATRCRRVGAPRPAPAARCRHHRRCPARSPTDHDRFRSRRSCAQALAMTHESVPPSRAPGRGRGFLVGSTQPKR